MDKAVRELLAKFYAQRSNAKKRGIGWELTFKQWCDWWGDDIHQRGCRVGQLSMQRVADTGPYRLDNIRKGFPSTNAKTAKHMRDKAKSERAAAELAEAQMRNPSHDAPDWLTEDEHHVAKELGYERAASWLL